MADDRIHVQSKPREDRRGTGESAGTTWMATLRRTVTEFSADNLSDSAAALTYYGLLALFPALIALVSIVGLVGNPTTVTENLTEIVSRLGPSSASSTFAGPIRSITAHRGTAGVLLVVGLLVSLYSASGYVGAFMRASNVIYETSEGRPFWKLRPLQVIVTLIMVLLVAVVALGLVLTGPVVRAVAGPLGVASSAVDVWDVAKWPALIALVILLFATLYFSTPNVRLRGFRRVMLGALLALVVWLIVSAAFAIYVANFGSYDRTYGSLGGAVVFLVWLWISNVALLLGAELNAERERTLELKAGVPDAAREIQLDARSAPKQPHTT